MYEDYYGFAEKPFSLTPDARYLYKSASHECAFELLQYAIRRREGFIVLTGDIGTGKTTLCRAVMGTLNPRTFTALVLNPFLSEEELLRQVLVDFGVVSRDEIKRGRLAGVSKQELIARSSSWTKHRTCRARFSSKSASCPTSKRTRRSSCRSSSRAS